VAWTLYDRFLKANRVSEGIASYDAVVSLVVGTRFVRPWTPALKIAIPPTALTPREGS
jgi:hypothetical protein